MRLHPLKLHVSLDNWRLFTARKASDAFRALSDQVLTRDNYTCQFCGFQASRYQQIINLDNDYRNSNLNNLVTACVFCAQCLFVESIGKGEYGGGTLVYLPEMSQPQLNGLCHVLFCAIANGTSYKTTAQNLYRSFKLRAQVVEKKFGDGSKDPAALGQMLLDTPSAKDPMVCERILTDLRVLPSRAKFKTQIEAWAAAAAEAPAAA